MQTQAEQNILQLPDDISKSWKGQFIFKRETDESSGLRSPQIGALHAIMAHVEEAEKKCGIVVMPTGTGKTETMLSFLVACPCKKVFVTVPSDSLRTQTYNKFKTLGVLPKIGVVPSTINMPLVKMVDHELQYDEWQDIVKSSNVIIATMAIASQLDTKTRSLLSQEMSFLFVDEAHHCEAETWSNFINQFPPEKVLMFTATPFRNDGRKLKGRIIFNFSLRKAQEQHYYEQINYLPVLEYTQEEADQAIAEKAVAKLKADIKDGYDHILMARCKDKKRATSVFELYRKHTDFNPVLIYSGIKNETSIIDGIKAGKHKIVVCVNMLGEGFDLPQLKVAAVHDERQSLAITLQFIGRFTRTAGQKLGKASFITNIANPPILAELNQLYQLDADWNLLLPRISEQTTTKERNLTEFLEEFKGSLKEELSLAHIRPALSAQVFKTDSTTTQFHNWKSCLTCAKGYDIKFDAISKDTLVIVLGKTSNVNWGDVKNIKDLTWDFVLVYFDVKSKLVYLNSTIKLNGSTFLKGLFGKAQLIQGEQVFRIFADINRLSLYSVGARLLSKDISFQSFIGKSVDDGLDSLTKGKLIANNLFGVGYRNGEKWSIGCSKSGKIWSRERADLFHFQEWCKEIGAKVTDNSIDTKIVLENTLRYEELKRLTTLRPLSLDWHPELYDSGTLLVSFGSTPCYFDDCELEISDETTLGKDIVFEISKEDVCCKIKLEIIKQDDEYICRYTNLTPLVNLTFMLGEYTKGINEFFNDYAPTFFLTDNCVQFGKRLCRQKNLPDVIEDKYIITKGWEHVNISHESQGSEPYIEDSIQRYMINDIFNNYDYIIDDDGKGEIADIVAISDTKETIFISLYHLKFAIGGRISNDINNLYQVCGQAQKSVRWKYCKDRTFFDHILKRNKNKISQNKSSIILKGTVNDILKLREESIYKKDISFHIYIVQPGMSKSCATREMKLLLGCTQQYLKQIANIDMHVICSE